MAAQNNLKPYRPFGASSHVEGLEQLPGENVVIPSPPGTKKIPKGDSFNAQPKILTLGRETKEGGTFKEASGPTETKLYSLPPIPPILPTPVRETPVEQSLVAGGKNAAGPAAVALIGIVLVSIFGIYATFEIQPKLRGLSIIKGLENPAKDLSAAFDRVDEALSSLMGLINSEEVPGQSAFASPNAVDENTNALRTLNEAARSSKKAVSSAEENLETFQVRIPVEFPESVKDLVEEAQSLSQRSDGLLLEAKKVTDFYSTSSSIQIDLLPTIKSLLTLIIELSQSPNPSVYSDKLSNIKQTANSLETQTRALNVFLPEGLEKVQDDNLAVFALLGNYLKDLEDAINTGSFKKFANSTQKLSLELKVITARAKTLELSYWQEAGLLKKTKAFSTDLTGLSLKLSAFRKNNKFPFFN